VDAVDIALASLDEESARRAAPAIDALLGSEDERMPVEALARLDVEDFLWAKLPTRWLTDDHDHHEIAWALGDLFTALGVEKYAALCRDRRTHEILAAWHRDPDEGARLANEAIEASGLLPPDTPTLTFGEVMGTAELQTFMELSSVLERAIDAGELDPRAKRERVRLVERHLVTGGLLAAVRRERAEAWAAGFRADPGWLGTVLPVLERESASPENVELSLAPARALLERVGDGLTLTASGYLAPAVAIELNDHFRWSDHVGKTPKREGDLPQLSFLREHLTLQRLLAVRKGVLSVTARGRACLADEALFWDSLTALTPRWEEFAQEVIALSAVLLLESPDVERNDLTEEVARMMRHRWKGGGDFERDVHWAYIDWYRVGFALGWWEAKRGRWLDRLSPRGVGAAARAFWSVAGAPGHYRD
jgi:hypothetical protein